MQLKFSTATEEVEAALVFSNCHEHFSEDLLSKSMNIDCIVICVSQCLRSPCLIKAVTGSLHLL